MSPAAIEDTPRVPSTLPPGHLQRFTGEILLRTRPKTYRKIVDYLAQGESALYISKECRCSRATIAAIAERRSASIEQRKKELSAMVSDIAHIGAARVADTIGKAKVRDAIIGTGVAIDKLLALEGTAPAVQVAVVNMPSEADRDERRRLHDKLDAIAARLNSEPIQ